MTEREKAEFEKHKSAAEKQLNEMYYGNNTRQKSGNGLKMPPFLSSAQNANQSQRRNDMPKDKSPAEKKNQTSPLPAKSEQKSSSKGINLLNMLNFKGMNMDNDRLIILAVCLLLSGEDADELLMLALMYIML